MKRLLSTAIALAALAFGVALPARAAQDPGRLLRSPEDPAVYYVLADGRRYAFPNARIFQSWFPSFSGVATVPAATLAQSRLAGVALYRPGRLVKVTTDPKVYYVGPNGQLSWIETEAVARALFGPTWAAQVDDLPDAFFAAYWIGTSIPNAAAAPTGFASLPDLTIAFSQGLLAIPDPGPAPVPTSTVPAVPTSTVAAPDIVLRTSAGTGVDPNETVRIDLFGLHALPRSLRLSVNGETVQACAQTQQCGYSFTHQLRSTITSYRIEAEGTFEDGTRRTQSLTLPITNQQAGALILSTSRDQSKPQEAVDLRAEWGDRLIQARQITLTVEGVDQKICYNATECTLSYGIDWPAGTLLRVVAIAEDTSGQRWTTPTSTIAVVTNDAPTIISTTDKAVAFTGDRVTVNVNAGDGDGIAFTEIWQGDQRVARCASGSCSFVTPTLADERTLAYRIVAEDARGARRELTLAPILVIGTVR